MTKTERTILYDLSRALDEVPRAHLGGTQSVALGALARADQDGRRADEYRRRVIMELVDGEVEEARAELDDLLGWITTRKATDWQ